MMCRFAIIAFLSACGSDARAVGPREPDFVRDVLPVLTKSGCNSGACHGSFQGRGGLRLSLLGFDPAADFDALTKDARGRRVFPSAPGQSLILRKPSLAMPHGGGLRLAPESHGYKILHAWITQGLAAPRLDLRVTRLEVSPAEIVLTAGQSAAIKVKAHWSDGRETDVTEWAQFEQPEEAVAPVSSDGTVSAAGPGRVAVRVRFMGQIAAVPVSTPFELRGQTTDFAPANFVDELLLAEWKKLSLTPAPLATDEEFLRRVYLDLIGTLPSGTEARSFLSDSSAEKRKRLIDDLLKRPEYVDYWALKWSDLLRAHRRSLGEKGLASFSHWLRGRLRENAPFNQIATELVTAEGNLYTNGPVAYYFVDKTPEELAETTAQVFLGVRLACAKCHHHPFEVWGQEDYYSLASFFSGITRKDNKESGAFGGAQAVRAGVATPIKHPKSGLEMKPQALGWSPAGRASDPRTELAGWLASGKNPRFARTVVNRYFGYLCGRGLVHPIDDLSTSNPPVFPAVLEALADDFTTHHYDLKHLLRTLCNSRAYQLASDPAPAVDADGKYLTRRLPTRLPAEVLLDAVNQATGTQELFANLPPGTRAIEVPDSNVDSYFLNVFGRPRRTSTCECERASRLDLNQVLHLANGAALQAKIESAEGRIGRLLKGSASDEALVEELYLAAFARFPTPDERKTSAEFLKSVASRKEAAEDLLWTLINCPEFVMNH